MIYYGALTIILRYLFQNLCLKIIEIFLYLSWSPQLDAINRGRQDRIRIEYNKASARFWNCTYLFEYRLLEYNAARYALLSRLPRTLPGARLLAFVFRLTPHSHLTQTITTCSAIRHLSSDVNIFFHRIIRRHTAPGFYVIYHCGSHSWFLRLTDLFHNISVVP